MHLIWSRFFSFTVSSFQPSSLMFLGKSLNLFVGILFGSFGFGFEGPNPNPLFIYLKRRWIWIWSKSIQDLRHPNPLISNPLTFFFKETLSSTFFFKLKMKPPSIPVLRFVSLDSSCALKHLYLSLLSIVNLNHKILIGLSRFICASVGSVWFVYDFFVGFVWFASYFLWACICW